MWTALIPAAMKLFGYGSEAISKYQDRKAEKEQAKHEATMERIRSQHASWKDEFLLVIWVVPWIAAWIPSASEWIDQGFARLSEYPDWYPIGFVGISFAIFGVNNVSKLPRLRK